MQDGGQSIHYAAMKGYDEIVDVLVDEFNVKPDAVNKVHFFIQQ